jgi:hypothetical protein
VLGPVPRHGQHTEAVLAELAGDRAGDGEAPEPAPDGGGDGLPAAGGA